MAFGVFVHRSDSVYDDSPAERYQFPRQYRDRVMACLNDWIIYYEPGKVADTRGYFAIAKITDVVCDPTAPNMYLAQIEAGSYLDFADPVPFKGPDGHVESGLLNASGKISGRAQSAVRPISAEDFYRIVALGLGQSGASLPRIRAETSEHSIREEQVPFLYEQERDRVAYWRSRITRDQVFRRIVLKVYDSRCAITGLRLINGGGRAEVEAAHIRSVESGGPDIVSNGLALSGTAHWMFDRGLISVSDDLEILVSRQVNDREAVRGMINSSGRLLAPPRAAYHPHPHFLRWHRENCFKA